MEKVIHRFPSRLGLGVPLPLREKHEALTGRLVLEDTLNLPLILMSHFLGRSQAKIVEGKVLTNRGVLPKRLQLTSVRF